LLRNLLSLATTLCAVSLASFFLGGRPPLAPLALAARVFALDFTLPMRAPRLIGFPQCGQFIPTKINPTVAYARPNSK